MKKVFELHKKNSRGEQHEKCSVSDSNEEIVYRNPFEFRYVIGGKEHVFRLSYEEINKDFGEARRRVCLGER